MANMVKSPAALNLSWELGVHVKVNKMIGSIKNIYAPECFFRTGTGCHPGYLNIRFLVLTSRLALKR